MSKDFDRWLQHLEPATSFKQVQETFEKDFNINNLLQPLELSTFFNEYWEQRPLIVSRKKSDYYSSLLSLQDIALIVCYTKPGFQLIKNGQVLKHNIDNIRNEFPSIRELYDLYYQGGTIILYSLQQYWKTISFFCRNLEMFLNHPVNVNAYLTPKSSQGFSPHFDTHDVFILQISGTKLWRIYDSFLSLPLVGDETQESKVPRDKLNAPLHEVLLDAGDLLYIPRGYVHEALTSECSSLHLTVGVNPFRWIDLISNALALVSEQNVSFRKTLPVGFLNDREIIASLKKQFEEQLELLLNNAVVEKAAERLARNLVKQLRPLPDGHFIQDDDINCIYLDTMIEKRKGMICNIFKEEGSGSVSIQFPGSTVKAPAYIEPALRFIAASEAFTVRAISDTLTDDGKLVLVRRLVREGLLKVVS